jgi:class 3 adenylate cyclase
MTAQIHKRFPAAAYLAVQIRNIFEAGGLRLKLAFFIAGLVFGSVFVLSAVVIPVQESSIRRKAYSVCEVSAIALSSAAGEMLTSQMTIVLRDTVRVMMAQNVEGMREVSILSQGKYYVNSTRALEGREVPEELASRVKEFREPKVYRNSVMYTTPEGKELEALEFVTPIIYQNRRIGYTRIVFDTEGIQREISSVIRLSALTALAVVVISLIGIYFLSGRISRPILAIAAAATRVGKGDLDVQVTVASVDEVGALGRQFNLMVFELKERLHMMKYVSESTVSQIKEHVAESTMHMGGRKDDLAFFFSDVRGFTSWSEKNKPEDVVSVLNEYLELQSRIIRANHGDIDKYVGDEIMAVFSGPDKDDRCIVAAIQIVQAMEAFNAEREQKGDHALRVGIGLHSGEVVVGNMGSSDRMDFTAIGDNVNLSARLCSSAKPLQILASGVIVSRAKKKYRTQKLEPILVKGKEKPIEVFGVLGLETEG